MTKAININRPIAENTGASQRTPIRSKKPVTAIATIQHKTCHIALERHGQLSQNQAISKNVNIIASIITAQI